MGALSLSLSVSLLLPQKTGQAGISADNILLFLLKTTLSQLLLILH